MQKILFVCTGNICRSPTAEGVLRHYLEAHGLEGITVDSAGTHGYHIGERPDPRSIAAAKKRGINIANLKARKLSLQDFAAFDLLLGLDYEHVELMKRMAPKGCHAEIGLFLDYAGATPEKEVPDPYYGEEKHFEHALDLIEAGNKALMEKLRINFKDKK